MLTEYILKQNTVSSAKFQLYQLYWQTGWKQIKKKVKNGHNLFTFFKFKAFLCLNLKFKWFILKETLES